MAKKNKKSGNESVALKPTTSSATTATAAIVSAASDQMLYGKRNYMLMFAGVGLIFVGYLLMAGGSMPSSDVWDDSLIYSTRRTLIAPIVILLGLGMQIYAIFSKK